MDMKRCPKCGEEKPATTEYWYASKQTHSGLTGWCKECMKAKSRQHHGDNREECNERSRRYHREHHVPRPLSRMTAEEAYEARLKASRAWKARNRQRVTAYTAAWYERNPAARRAYEAVRRAAKMSAGGTHTREDIAAQHRRQRGRCYWCGESVGGTYHVDHVIPLSRGGSNGPENIVISCPTCNMMKGAKMPSEFVGVLC